MEPREEETLTEADKAGPDTDNGNALQRHREQYGPTANPDTALDPAVAGYRDPAPKGTKHTDPIDPAIPRDVTTSKEALGGDPAALGLAAQDEHPDGIVPPDAEDGRPYGSEPIADEVADQLAGGEPNPA